MSKDTLVKLNDKYVFLSRDLCFNYQPLKHLNKLLDEYKEDYATYQSLKETVKDGRNALKNLNRDMSICYIIILFQSGLYKKVINIINEIDLNKYSAWYKNKLNSIQHSCEVIMNFYDSDEYDLLLNDNLDYHLVIKDEQYLSLIIEKINYYNQHYTKSNYSQELDDHFYIIQHKFETLYKTLMGSLYCHFSLYDKSSELFESDVIKSWYYKLSDHKMLFKESLTNKVLLSQNAHTFCRFMYDQKSLEIRSKLPLKRIPYWDYFNMSTFYDITRIVNMFYRDKDRENDKDLKSRDKFDNEKNKKIDYLRSEKEHLVGKLRDEEKKGYPVLSFLLSLLFFTFLPLVGIVLIMYAIGVSFVRSDNKSVLKTKINNIEQELLSIENTQFKSEEKSDRSLQDYLNEFYKDVELYAPKIYPGDQYMQEYQENQIQKIRNIYMNSLNIKESMLLKLGDLGRNKRLCNSAPTSLDEVSSASTLFHEVFDQSFIGIYKDIAQGVIFTTQNIQYIFLFNDKIGILEVCYDLISDQVLNTYYQENYYYHINGIEVNSGIVMPKNMQNRFMKSKDFKFNMTSGKSFKITIVDHDLMSSYKSKVDDKIKKYESARNILKGKKGSNTNQFFELKGLCSSFGIDLHSDLCSTAIRILENEKHDLANKPNERKKQLSDIKVGQYKYDFGDIVMNTIASKISQTLQLHKPYHLD